VVSTSRGAGHDRGFDHNRSPVSHARCRTRHTDRPDLHATAAPRPCRPTASGGLVVDAGVCDVDELTQMRVGFGRRRSAQGTVKETLGNVQTPVIRAGVPVAPSDVIVADADGLWRCAGPPRRRCWPRAYPHDLALQTSHGRDRTSDIYELIVERHQRPARS